MFDFPSADMTLICPSCSVLNHPEAPRCRSCGTMFDAPPHAGEPAFASQDTAALPPQEVWPTPPPAAVVEQADPPPPSVPPPAVTAGDGPHLPPEPPPPADAFDVGSPVSTPAPPEAIPVAGVAASGLTPPPDTAWSDAPLGMITPHIAAEAPFPEPEVVDHGSSEWTATADAFFGEDAADANPDPFAAGPDWTTDGRPADEATSYPTADDTLVHTLAEGVPAPLGTPGTAARPGVSGPPVGELVGPYGRSQALLGVMTVGRDPRNAIVLNDPSVSRVHCRLEARQGYIHVTDLRSTNGTWVNGRRIDEVDLAHGDRVLLGRTELVFHGFGMPAPTASNGSGTIPDAAEVPPDTATA